jgi:hypothetical protein
MLRTLDRWRIVTPTEGGARKVFHSTIQCGFLRLAARKQGIMNDFEVIEAFVAYLRGRGHPGLRVDSWPDRERPAEIDALAGAFAIEHTSIDTLQNQRRDDDWFSRVVSGLEAELSTPPAGRLHVILEYHAVHTGQDWSAIREALKVWIAREVPRLADGRHSFGDIAGIPFRLRVTKASNRPSALLFVRSKPVDDNLSARIRTLCDRKAQKLAKHQSAGKRTILLVENADIALMNDEKMLEAIRRAYPDGLPMGVDALWYADTAISDDIEFRDFTAMFGSSAARQAWLS